jgi:hypothetical protein
MPSLSETLAALSQAFAEDVLAVARSTSIEDIISNGAPMKHGPGRPRGSSTKTDVSALPTEVKRMGPAMIDSTASLIVSYVKSHQGVGGAEIRKELGIPANKWLRPLALALEKKGLSKQGKKRATTYWVR